MDSQGSGIRGFGNNEVRDRVAVEFTHRDPCTQAPGDSIRRADWRLERSVSISQQHVDLLIEKDGDVENAIAVEVRDSHSLRVVVRCRNGVVRSGLEWSIAIATCDRNAHWTLGRAHCRTGQNGKVELAISVEVARCD